jgi:AdoMet-dependent rRNA methyltransferase SPB1
MPKHVKGHDKDKYYHLAKDQGYRARSAFKLIQINKRFGFLQTARVCIDLCAAPGGWCQVAVQLMPKGALVLGVDILPIRTIRGVKTLQNDITTAECRRNVAAELNGFKADVVLCDGAPNIGSAYHKDAFVQNELVLASLKTATDHLIAGGTFCTKVYRSSDYNALMWVFQQLFEDVQAIKPNSSRSQSAEIFIVCLKFTKPDKIDPKLLDPNHIFKQVADPGLAKVDVMHKKYDKLNKRHRVGYEWESGLLTSSHSISGFVAHAEPVRVLTDYNELKFEGPECEKYRSRQYTTPEMLECFKDLRVLGKADFKKILKWRQRMIDLDKIESDDKAAADGTKVDSKSKRPALEPEREETDADVYEDIMELRAKAAQDERRAKKKEKVMERKERERQRLGMSANAFDGSQEDLELFSFSKSGKARKLVEDALDEFGDKVASFESDEDDEDDGNVVSAVQHKSGQRRGTGPLVVEDTLEDEMEQDYLHHKRTRKNKVKDNSGSTRGNKMDTADDEMLANKLLEERQREDASFLLPSKGRQRQDQEDREAYAALLNKGSQPETGSLRQGRLEKKGKASQAVTSDSSSDDDEEEEEEAESEVEDADEDEDEDEDGPVVTDTVDDDVERILKGRQGSERNDQWYSHPIFKQTLVDSKGEDDDSQDEQEDEDEYEYLEEDDSVNKPSSNATRKGKGAGAGAGEERISRAVQELVDAMPKTDKQKRAEKRKKDQERADRKKARREVSLDDMGADSQWAVTKTPSKGNTHYGEDEEEAVEDQEEKQAAAIRKTPEILKGMGKALKSKQKDKDGFEVVPRDSGAEDFSHMRKDTKTYDSDDEEYSAKDRAEQLALGTLMLRRSRKKALVDASYNRFAWNDPDDLPSWFLDDERQHNKPQIPIPPALLEQIKSKYQMTGTKSIKKVAEAKMRKKKHAQKKLSAAKKSANTLVDNNEMSEKQKLRAIQKAMKTSKVDKPSKVYVVSTKAAGSTRTSGGKGALKFVDKRMRSDKRGEKAAKKRQKKGRKK